MTAHLPGETGATLCIPASLKESTMKQPEILDAMLLASKIIPQEGFWESAAQELAAVAERHWKALGDDVRPLIAAGALMARQGEREFQAGLHTDMIFQRVGGK